MTKSDNASTPAPISDVVAVLLCGGRGERLKPRTNDVPKPLISLNGTPILGHVLSYYRRLGVERKVICTGYLSEKIESYVRQSFPSMEATFSNSGVGASMLKRLFDVRDSMSETIVVGYGDTLVDVDLEEMLRLHRESGASVTITGATVVSPWGLYTAGPEGRVESFREKPKQLYYVGQFVAQKEIFRNLDPALLDLPDGEGLIRLFHDVIQQGMMFHKLYEGPQITFNTHEELRAAERDIVTFFTE